MLWGMGVCGQRLAYRLRLTLYEAILHMEASGVELLKCGKRQRTAAL